jgi:hypothetical protein
MAKYTKSSETQLYETNPSILPVATNLVNKKTRTIFKDGNRALVDASTGELAGQLQKVFITDVEVDTEKFVKIYASSIDELMNLSGSGLKVFKLIYAEIMSTPNADSVYLDFNELVHFNKWKWSQTTFISGVNELLTKNIIYRSIGNNKYFINIGIFFNGDRISVINTYRLKQQHNLIDDEENLPPPNKPTNLIEKTKEYISDKFEEAAAVRATRSEKLNSLIARLMEKGFSKDEATDQALELI